MLDQTFIITAFTTLFVIIDPIGLAPVFLALTSGMPRAKRRRIAIRACVVALGSLLLFAVFGEAILTFIGISMPAFRIAGGVLLFLTALDMLFERRQSRREDRAEEEDLDHDDPSVFPLAIPLLSGPGAIATIILLVGETDTVFGFATVIAVVIAVLGIAYALFEVAGRLETALGRTGIVVITRVFGMLLAALAIQFILDGITGYGEGLMVIRGGR